MAFIPSLYTVLTMMGTLPDMIYDSFDTNLGQADTIVYTFPDSRIAATNAIAEHSFGNDFLFGVASSAYQVEGAWNDSDKSPSIWDALTHQNPELIADHSNGDVAADSYHKYMDDIELVGDLGAQAYRISLSWTRILPDGFDNRISVTGVEYYNKMINEMLRRRITPVVTLYHWDLPQGLQLLGGWTNPLIVDWFVDYARVAFMLFGDRVKMWTTLNEPSQFCTGGYGLNLAPIVEQRGVADYLCGHYALLAHAKVYRMYELEFRQKQKGKVGIAMSTTWPIPEKQDEKEYVEAAERFFEFTNGWFMHPIFHPDGDYPPTMRTRVDANSADQGFSKSRLPVFSPDEIELIRASADYLGLNFYLASVIRTMTGCSTSVSILHDIGGFALPEEKIISPRALRLMLNEFDNRYKIPMMYITENGYGDNCSLADTIRANYYHVHLTAVLDAMHDGVDVRGYFAWSLIDNFEWTAGYTICYGLFNVNFDDPDQERTPKLSARVVRDIYRTRKVS